MAILIAGLLALSGSPALASEPPPVSFGDDSGSWAKDGECDDARFVGAGMAADVLVGHIGRDATDCSAAWDDGRLQMNGFFLPLSSEGTVNFGGNSSEFANNGLCDDVRFLGEHTATMIYLVEDVGADARDCKAAMESGAVTYQGDALHPDIGESSA